jgi:hypothetical protein
MLDKLRHSYGSTLGACHGLEVHAFPTLDELARATEQELRDMGFGYRCVFAFVTAFGSPSIVDPIFARAAAGHPAEQSLSLRQLRSCVRWEAVRRFCNSAAVPWRRCAVC